MRKKTVLIAEDKPVIAADLSFIIKNMGLEVSGIVSTGEDAIEKIKQKKADLLLMDIMLKGYYTGIEAAEIIRRHKSIPVIYITALKDDETFLRAYSTNPAAIIVKPYSVEIVKAAVLQAVGIKEISLKTSEPFRVLP